MQPYHHGKLQKIQLGRAGSRKDAEADRTPYVAEKTGGGDF